MKSISLRRCRAAAGCLLLLAGFTASKPAQASYSFKPVVMGGGGFITGIVMSRAKSGVIFARTDVGGAYRWNPAGSTWTPLLDWITSSNWNYGGVESIALDPSNANNVYMAVGQYTNHPAAILISNDQGNTWTTVGVPFVMGSNTDGRSNGERLQVDPNLGSILFFGSRQNGLWKSVNSGATWSQVTSFPVTSTANGCGVNFIQFVKSSGVSGQATPTLYAGVSQTGGNLYKSTDGGATWAAVSGAPSTLMPQRCSLDSDGTLYVTYGNACGPSGVSTGQVWKFATGTGVWTNITPVSNQGGFSGVCVDPQHTGTVTVSTIDDYWPHEEIYRSTNAGATWSAPFDNTSTVWDSSLAPYTNGWRPNWTADIEIDPFNANHAMVTSGYGLYDCVNFTNADTGGATTWAFHDGGIEEMVVNQLIAPPTGVKLLSVFWDYGGFQHTNLDSSPAVGGNFNPEDGANWSIDFAQSNPNIIARTTSSTARGAYSTNNGTSWTEFASTPAPAVSNGGGAIAVSATGSAFVWGPNHSAPYYSTNNGATWTLSNGPSSSSNSYAPIADRVNGGKFYLYAQDTGKFYVSTDSGATWTNTATVTQWGSAPRAVPGIEGDVWLPIWDGLYHSTNSGASFTKLTTVSAANMVAFGKAAPGASYPALFINGTVGGVAGVYESDDAGATWTAVTDAQHQYSSLNCITGDPNTYGRLYLGLGGRGAVYADKILVPNGTYSIIGINSGMALDVLTSVSNGGPVMQETATGVTSQKWTVTNLGANTVKITSNSSYLALEVYNQSTSPGGPVDQWGWWAAPSQTWRLTPVGVGIYTLTNLNSGLVLDVPGGSKSPTQLEQWTANGGKNQQWKFQ